MENTDELELKLLPDSPVLKSESQYYDFYHDYISPTLHKITNKQIGIHTIGLFGNWGSGKSTIIENLKKDNNDTPVFVFDVWKYQGDPLRRTFLINFFSFINRNNLWQDDKKLEEDYLDDLYEGLSISQEIDIPKEKKPKNSKLRKLFGPLFQIFKRNPVVAPIASFSLIGITCWIFGQYFLGEKYKLIALILQIPGYIIAISGVTTVLIKWAGEEVIKTVTKLFIEDLRSEIKSQTIIRHREYLNSPEQFEKKFFDIVQSINQKIIIVFDNIDRVHGDTAIEILSSIKTFIEPKIEKNVIFIIPCDSDAIEQQIKNYYGKITESKIDTSEYLRKLFNVIIWTPDFISTDIEEFTRKQIEQLGSDKGLLKDNDDLVRVITQAFKSPREIKQFLNNLVAAIMVVSGTDVWNEVSTNIPYLAKVLVLRQKYPDAYKRLKQKWYQPEDIVKEGDKDSELRDFMVSTSRTSVSNAEPYIYFKIPNTEKHFSNSKELLPILASAKVGKSKEIISKHKETLDPLLDFIESLYSKYQSQEEILTKIVSTFFKAITELNIEINKVRFLNRSAEVIEKYIWQNYRVLDTNIIFARFIKNSSVNRDLRSNLLQRYTAALESQELIDEPGKATAKNIIENLSLVQNIPVTIQKQINSAIETSYINDVEIVRIFKKIEVQKRFITKNALEKYIQTINLDSSTNILQLITPYKAYLTESLAADIFIKTLTSLVTEERAKTPENNDQKQSLIGSIEEFIKEPESILEGADKDIISSLESELILTYKTISTLDNKGYLIPVIYFISIYIDESHPDIEQQADDLISEFIKAASIDALGAVLSRFDDQDKRHFINYYSNDFTDRGLKDGHEQLKIRYELMKAENQKNMLNNLIDQREDGGLSFIQTISEFPDRAELIRKVTSRVPSLPRQHQDAVYKWLSSMVKINDEAELRDPLINQIKNLLHSDDSEIQSIGFNFLSLSQFLSISQKSNIGDEAIEWLRTPGKIVNYTHRYILKAISSLFATLTPTRQNDFIFILFDMLGRENEQSTNEVAIEIIVETGITWKKYQSYYENILEKIGNWPSKDIQNHIITEMISKIKPDRTSRSEEHYWNQLDLIKNN